VDVRDAPVPLGTVVPRRVRHTQAQEAFLQGHVLAFAHFGAVPARIRYDNLKPAVVRVLRGRDRTESERIIALRSHYSYDSFFCIPGKDGAHEKGGVEGEIGRFPRRHLVPIPNVASLAELNTLIAAGDLLDDTRVITGRPVTIAAAFAAELPALLPLPGEPVDPTRLLEARVDNRARVAVRQCYYSVPARYSGRRLAIRVSATAVEVLDAGKIVAKHERAAGRYVEVLTLDHYLEVLKTKPGALPGATALAQAKACGTRMLIEVLLAHRTLPADALITAMRKAVDAGVLDPQGRAHRRPPRDQRAGRGGDPDRGTRALRPADTDLGRLRLPTHQEWNMSARSEDAAQAAIGAAARELHLPTVRTDAVRLAEAGNRPHRHRFPGLGHEQILQQRVHLRCQVVARERGGAQQSGAIG
jgi:hypothetical protein